MSSLRTCAQMRPRDLTGPISRWSTSPIRDLRLGPHLLVYVAVHSGLALAVTAHQSGEDLVEIGSIFTAELDAAAGLLDRVVEQRVSQSRVVDDEYEVLRIGLAVRDDAVDRREPTDVERLVRSELDHLAAQGHAA